MLTVLGAKAVPVQSGARPLKDARCWRLRRKKPRDHLMVINLSGRGDKDILTVADHLGGM